MFTKCCLSFKISSSQKFTLFCRNKSFFVANGQLYKYSTFTSSIISKQLPAMDRNAVRRDSSFVSSSTSSSVLVSKVSNAPLTNLDEATWHELAGKDEFKNWLRICLGLKVCKEFLAPHKTSTA